MESLIKKRGSATKDRHKNLSNDYRHIGASHPNPAYMKGNQSFDIYTESTSRTTGMPQGIALSSGASSHMRGSIAAQIPKSGLKRKIRANYSSIKS